MVLNKTYRNEEDFFNILESLKEIINIVNRGDYKYKFILAREISPDNDDSDYFAPSLKLDCAIWSNDKKLKEQNKIKVYSTKELLDLLK